MDKVRRAMAANQKVRCVVFVCYRSRGFFIVCEKLAVQRLVVCFARMAWNC